MKVTVYFTKEVIDNGASFTAGTTVALSEILKQSIVSGVKFGVGLLVSSYLLKRMISRRIHRVS